MTTISHYRLDGEIGRGGMGVVHRAVDTKLGRQVAIKVLPAHATSDPERRRRFIQEARAASALNHPHMESRVKTAVFASAGLRCDVAP
ncbi:MAG TPA: hypothetical protein VFN38_07570, partial [Gemmatimonadaceae bacterium]|nr:hypothetical protein [Gemmatimonadaceae bacterium]